MLFLSLSNQGFAIFPVKVRKYIIKAFAKLKKSASLLFRLINANISVNEQPEWFHWAHRWWPFYTHCTSRTRFKSWSFYGYRKAFWRSRSITLTCGNTLKMTRLKLFTITKISISELEYTRPMFIYTIILCCPCYMPKYVPRLEGIMHDPKSALCLLTVGHILAYNMDNTILLLLLL